MASIIGQQALDISRIEKIENVKLREFWQRRFYRQSARAAKRQTKFAMRNGVRERARRMRQIGEGRLNVANGLRLDESHARAA